VHFYLTINSNFKAKPSDLSLVSGIDGIRCSIQLPDCQSEAQAVATGAFLGKSSIFPYLYKFT